MTKKKDENLSKREALILAWKSRKDYKGYDKAKGGMYNSWRAKIYTKKGKQVGFPQKWETFEGFKEDMKEGWINGYVLVRKNIKEPYSKENCEWREKGVEIVSKLCTLEYNGETKTLIEWSKIYHLNYGGVRNRYFKLKCASPEEILFGDKYIKLNQPVDISTLSYQAKRNKISKMLSAYKSKDWRKGRIFSLTNNELEEYINQPCYYCGDTRNVGLDRIDNKKGHTKDNVVPCCVMCNTVRNDLFSVEEMKIIGETIKQIKLNREKNK